jgi:OOP family OmpA-OmpF porin
MKKILIASLLSSLFAAPAFASVPGPYVALDLQNWNASSTGALGNPGIGARIGAGYRFTENWGVEANYAQSGSSSSVGGQSYKAEAFQIAATGTYPINPQFDVYAKLGASANKISPSGFSLASSSKTDLLWGIGGQYNFTRNWGARLEYEGLGKATGSGNTGGSDFSLSTISLGAVYAF